VNGYEFRFFNSENTSAFQSDSCKALVFDDKGRLWIGTKTGLILKDKSGFQRFTSKHGLPHDEITSLSLGSDGQIWIGTDDGLAVYDEGGFVTFRAERSDVAYQHIYSVMEDSKGRV
jgi:ligand-binding sensor domain-containing protein